jgi:hypothetical protein
MADVDADVDADVEADCSAIVVKSVVSMSCGALPQ